MTHSLSLRASLARKLAYDALFWRKLAYLGASRGPEWLVRFSPPFFGALAAIAVPEARRMICANLERVSGPAPALVRAIDVTRTFAAYASCLAEVLSIGSKTDRPPEATVYGERHVESVVRRKRGAVFVTAHTGGWELVGTLLSRDHDLELMIVMERERDEAARQLQDHARSSRGLHIVHVGDDALAPLPLLAHLRAGGVVALQIDRNPHGMKSRAVTLFDAPGTIPEGPLRLAQLSGAPIVPLFAARTGFRQYEIHAFPPVEVPRRATEDDLDAAAEHVAAAMTAFVRRHPTQWFHFGAH